MVAAEDALPKLSFSPAKSEIHSGNESAPSLYLLYIYFIKERKKKRQRGSRNVVVWLLLFLVVQKHFQRANSPFNIHVPSKTLIKRNVVGSVITTDSLAAVTSGSARIQQGTAEYPGDIQTD